MFRLKMYFCLKFYVIVMSIQCTVGQIQLQQNPHHHHHHKPWPTYSLQNMPQTRFTCHDKILGGYYADAETQCQMFHVCVKVAGGVQDFRFLCPNSTAFDQEAQICADWGDVDCEQSVLYYGSDNFDLYRIGSEFESKRAPLAEEEEATFHLQRAESADIRRSKETRVDQQLRPDHASHFIKQQNFKNYNNNNNNNNNRNNHNLYEGDDVKRLAHTKPAVANFYTPTLSTATTTRKPRIIATAAATTTTAAAAGTIERYNDESRQELDEIFKGSHSSHFFANRNGGREDDFQELPAKTSKKSKNDFNDYSHKFAETSTSGKTRIHPTRGRHRHSQRSQEPQQHSSPAEPLKSAAATTTKPLKPPQTTTTTTTAKFTQKLTSQPFYRTSAFDTFTQPQQKNKPSTTTLAKSGNPTPKNAVTITASTVTVTARPKYASSVNRFSFSAQDLLTHENIKPTTYNPANSVYRIQATTAKYPAPLTLQQAKGGAAEEKHPSLYNAHSDKASSNSGHNEKSVASHQARRKPQRQPPLLAHPQNSTFVNHEEFAEFSKIKPQEPEAFKPAPIFRPPPPPSSPPPEAAHSKAAKSDLAPSAGGSQNELRTRGRAHASKPSANYQEPKPFSASQSGQRKQNGEAQNHGSQARTSTDASRNGDAATKAQPRGFVSRGSINYKASGAQRVGDSAKGVHYSSSSSSGSGSSNNTPKKFSTLVPKEQKYQPTTFKPTTYKKAYEVNSLYQAQQTPRSSSKPQATKSNALPTAATSTAASSSLQSHQNPDEDDGQYHPELYEVDFPKNRFKLQRATTGATTATATITHSASSTTTKKPNSAGFYNNNNNYPYPQTHLKTQQHTFFQKQQQEQQQQQQQKHQRADSGASIDFSDEDDEELFKTAHSLNFGAASINKLRADIFKAEKTSQQYNSQYGLSQSQRASSSANANAGGPAHLPTTSSAVFSYPTFVPSTVTFGTTSKPFSSLTTERPINTTPNTGTTGSTTTTTTPLAPIRTTPPAPAAALFVTTTPRLPSRTVQLASSSLSNQPTGKSHKSPHNKSKSTKSKKISKSSSSSSKRPPHAPEDASYDYAYYDSDTLSETPQAYPEYEISEFTKTHKI